MRKKIIVILLTIGCTLQLHLAAAQEAEIAQLLLNVEKLAQFKSILKDMKRGYEVISKGYGTIKDISEGNFSLHKTFLDGLLAVNPEIAKYRKVAGIIDYQIRLISEYKKAFTRFKSSGRFTPDEIAYLGKVYGNLFDRSLDNLDELAMVLTANRMRMSDEERLDAIDRIYDDMQDKLVFLRSFNKKTSSLDNGRKSEQEQLKTLKGMTGK